MKCKKCGSESVNVQAVAVTKKKGHGPLYWLYWICCGWIIDLMLWIFLTLPMLLIKIFKSEKTKTKINSMAVCQHCGFSWKA